MIQLSLSLCTQGHKGKNVSLDFGTWSFSISGSCGGPYIEEAIIDHRKPASKYITAKVKHKIQHELARFMSTGEVNRAEGEKFLDELFNR